MRTRLRTGAVVGVAIALVLSLPSPGASRPAPTAAGDSGRSPADAERILERVGAALAPGAAPARTPGDVLGRADVTLLLRDLRMARAALNRTERAAADRYLARPSASSCSGTVIVKTHFCVHYSTGLLAGANATTPEQAQLTAAVLETVWSREVGGLGFRPPPDDGDGLFDVYLQQLGNRGLYGYCAPDENAAHSSSYCVLDNDYATSEYGAPPGDSLRATAAHEFFHAIQFGYDTGEDLWFMEGTAVWAEEQVYPSINDYLQYLPYSAVTRPRTPADYSGLDGSRDLFFRYGAVLFWKFLSERFRTPVIVRRVWQYADAAAGSRYSLRAVAAALAERGTSFAATFAHFGVWNTLPVGSYGDRALFPAPSWWRVTRLNRSRRDTARLGVGLDHLTNAALVVRPGRRLPKRTRLRVVVDAPALSRAPRALMQVRRRDGTMTVVAVPLDGTGAGRRTVRFNPRVVSRVVVTLTNASIRMTGCGTDAADRFSCSGAAVDDDQAFAVRARLRRL